VFGVPPNTFRLGFSLKATYPKMRPWEGIGEEVGRETRPTATGTVALPILSRFCGNPLKTSRNRILEGREGKISFGQRTGGIMAGQNHESEFRA
jgi:hypothetical protein